MHDPPVFNKFGMFMRVFSLVSLFILYFNDLNYVFQNKKFLLPSKTVDKQPQNIKSLSLGNGNTINVNSDLILASSQIDQTQQQLLSDCQRNVKDQMNNPSFDQKSTNQANLLNVDKVRHC